MIVTDIEKLNKPTKTVSLEEGERIAKLLYEELGKTKTGVGLSANQIGIDARVCVITVKEPIHLINPKIIEQSKKTFTFEGEGCLSFPGQNVNTERHIGVVVKADNYDGLLYFSATDNEVDQLEVTCVQHEIDHLDGVTMFDRQLVPVKVDFKFGRNDRVTIVKNGETKEGKWKKLEVLVKEEGWEIV